MNAKTAIAVAVKCSQWEEALPKVRALLRKAARAALAGARRDGAPVPAAVELSLVLADASFVRGLNRDYRMRNKPTNVLSFSAYTAKGLAEEVSHRNAAAAVPIGDVVLAFEVVRAEAHAQGKAVADHLAHLVVHGTLHLLGYDHVRTAAAERMERLEIAVLRRLGISDPYDLGRERAGAPRARLAGP